MMSTLKHYYDEPYLKEYDFIIKDVLKNGIIPEATIAYPEGGGQKGDEGTIDGIPFYDTQKKEDDILLLMKDTSSFKVGDKAHLVLNWEKRYDYMRKHTAQHMLSGTFFTALCVGTLAIHLGEDLVTVETDKPELTGEEVRRVEDLVNKAVRENHEVTYLEMSHKEAEAMGLRRSIKVEGEVRLVKIEGVDLIACGGLHVSHTGEVGEIYFSGSESIRGHVRTMWRIGEQAVANRRACQACVNKLSAIFSSPLESLTEAAEHAVKENKELKAEMRVLEREVATLLIENRKDKIIVSPVPLTAFKECAGEDLFIIKKEEGRCYWLLLAPEEKFRALSSRYGEFKMKGGGRDGVYQGTYPPDKEEEILSFVRELLNGRGKEA